MRAREPVHEVAERIGDGLQQRLRQACGKLDAQRVAISRGVLDGDDARLTGDWQLDGTARGEELVDRADQRSVLHARRELAHA